MKIAVVTPYWRVTPKTLARCISSVQRQTIAATHYLVADGEPQAVAARHGDIHLVLPANVGNTGATPRGMGAQLAFNDGCDAVAFLDADNWLEPDHLAKATALLERESLDIVFARRHIVFPDGERLPPGDEEDEAGDHVDTSCYVISRRASFMAGIWGMYPGAFGSGGDRLPLHVIRLMGLRTGFLPGRTVWYETNWPQHYQRAGKVPTGPLRQPARSVTACFDPQTYRQHTGITLPFLPGPQSAGPEKKHPRDWRIAVVTPWRGGDGMALRRCIDSVRRQGDRLSHVVVCRGPPPAEASGMMCLPLPGGGSDAHGGTASGLGAMLAFQLGFDAVAFLDAGSVLRPGHLDAARAALAAHPADVLVSSTADLLDGLLIARSAAHLGILMAQLPPLPTRAHAATLLVMIARARAASVHHLATGTPTDAAPPMSSATPFTLDAATLFQRTGVRAAGALT